MLEGLKALFTGKPQEDLAEWAAAGALIVDVRSPSEYASGHIPGSLNLPLDSLPAGLAKHRKGQSVIVCCASGMRSGMAKRLLEADGHAPVANGGSWLSLKARLGK